jgi:phage gp16-like protein
MWAEAPGSETRRYLQHVRMEISGEAIVTTRNALIQRIHVLKRDLHLDDEIYRDILGAISEGRTSCKQLDEDELNLVKIALERMQAGRQSGTSTTKTNVQQHKKISKLGFILQWNWKRIAEFCEQQTGKRSTQKCSAAELTKVVNGMIGVIDDRLAKGSLVLPHDDLALYLKYTQQHRQSFVGAHHDVPTSSAGQPS